MAKIRDFRFHPRKTPKKIILGLKFIGCQFIGNPVHLQASNINLRNPMPQFKQRQFLEFEKPVKELFDQQTQLKETAEKNKVDLSTSIQDLEDKILLKRREIAANLTPWQKVQMSRHPDRPYTLAYIKRMCQEFRELYGDRGVRDDKAIVGGLASIDGETVMIIGQQKGVNTKMRQMRNFGMANPEGYRKALRLMKLAEKFNKPIITLIDTPGAFPGIEAEERGQGEAIARNIFEMIRLKVPVVCVVIGEGASGGAMGIGVGDKVLMMENTWYTVISPESCSSILWRSWEMKEKAAEELKLTADNMFEFGLVDGIIPEPVGGAHWDYEQSAQTLKEYVMPLIHELKTKTHQERVLARIEKYGKMGFWSE
jgi:acetyl-CoA carboxylase carboxyl transferase subunit alpha